MACVCKKVSQSFSKIWFYIVAEENINEDKLTVAFRLMYVACISLASLYGKDVCEGHKVLIYNLLTVVSTELTQRAEGCEVAGGAEWLNVFLNWC